MSDEKKVRLGDLIRIVFASDNNYTMPLAVAGRSVIDLQQGSTAIEIIVLSDGISGENKKRLLCSWNDFRVSVSFIDCENLVVPDLRRDSLCLTYLSKAAYLRIFLDQLLPNDVGRVLYLDCDLVVLADIKNLWVTELGSNVIVGSVQDTSIPYHNSKRGSWNTPILYKPGHRYFNSGVMLIDLRLWREKDIGNQTRKLLADKNIPLPFPDQDALNFTLDGYWSAIDPVWNVPADYHFRGWSLEGFGNQLPHRDLSPKILHYCGKGKPWHLNYDRWIGREACGQYFQVLDRTDWKGWRPPVRNHSRDNASFILEEESY